MSDLSPETIDWLDEYFDHCLNGQSQNALAGVAARCTAEFRVGILKLGIEVARADGPITFAEWQSLRQIAARLGFQTRLMQRHIGFAVRHTGS
jgi:hypothetical protein